MSELGWQVAQGQRGAPATGRGLCLSNARQIVEAALGISLYSSYPFAEERTAANAERSWAAAGLAVSTAQPGDLLFLPGDTDAGHVGLLLGERDGVTFVLENTTSNRGRVVGGQQFIRLTPLSEFGTPRTIIRFPEDEKTPEDVGTAPGAAPRPGPSERPGVPFAVPLLDLINRGGPDLPDTPRVDRTQPDWVYRTLAPDADRAPGTLLTNLGNVSSIVILRAPYQSEQDYSFPVLGPISVAGAEWRDTLIRTWNTLKARYIKNPESWGRFYGPLMDFSISPERYRLPIPYVTSITVDHDVDGNAWADVECHVSDHEMAEMLFATLTMANRYKNCLCEIWCPFTYMTPTGFERTILQPVHIGVIEEVVAAPYPHGIKFRIQPQDHAMNQVGMNPDNVRTHWDDATVAQIIEDIAADHHLLIVTPSAPTLADLPPLQRRIKSFNALGRPPLDTLRELVERAGGLTFQRLAGTELSGYRLPGLPRGVWAVIDPGAYHPFTPGFFQNSLWSRVLAPIASAVLPEHDPVGEVAVIVPQGLLDRDPKYVSRLASVLETWGTPGARKAPLTRFLDTLSGLAASVGIGGGTAVGRAYETGVGSALLSFLDEWWEAAGSDAAPRVMKLIYPALSLDEFTVRSPDPATLAAPVTGTPYGVTLEGGRIRAGGAVPLGLEAQTNGSFVLTTPPGAGPIRASDTATLSYGRQYARPSQKAAGPVDAEEAERVSAFYPYELTVSLSPRASLRAGMLAVLIGTGRPDGIWTVKSVRHELNGSTQTLTAVLRCQRDWLLV